MTTPDDERTLTRGAPFPNLPGEYADALPASTRLHEFDILSVIGQGGFGIVYLAHDLTLERHVAIKEYMPSALATRTQSMTVSIRSDRHAETFAAGLRSFVNEARLLAQFDHPSLLKVYRFWEAHGTAYMVMPYYLGTTLAKQLTQLAAPPDEAWLKALLYPLLDALAMLHAAHCFHRDIAPDNGDPENRFCADRAIRRDARPVARGVDRPLRARIGSGTGDYRPHAAPGPRPLPGRQARAAGRAGCRPLQRCFFEGH